MKWINRNWIGFAVIVILIAIFLIGVRMARAEEITDIPDNNFYILIMRSHQPSCGNCGLTYRKIVSSPKYAATMLWQFNSELGQWTYYSGELFYITINGRNIERIAIPQIKFIGDKP